MFLADVGINGRHINNNQRERLNGEIKDCTRRARGFKSPRPALVLLHSIYYNFVHRARRKKQTPAEFAGIFVEGPDKFIQNAALLGTHKNSHYLIT